MVDRFAVGTDYGLLVALLVAVGRTDLLDRWCPPAWDPLLEGCLRWDGREVRTSLSPPFSCITPDIGSEKRPEGSGRSMGLLAP